MVTGADEKLSGNEARSVEFGLPRRRRQHQRPETCKLAGLEHLT